MDTISIESQSPLSLQEASEALSRHWPVTTSSSDGIVVHGNKGRAYLYLEAVQGESPYRLMLDYSDVDLAKKILEVIADKPNIIVNNDFGTVLPGAQFVARIREDRGWDWRAHDGNS
jgi:hypothetical protein